MKYTVKLSRNGCVNAEYRDMTENQATKAAKEEIGHGNDVYIVGLRESDHQRIYLNPPNGNASMVGKNWDKKE